MCAFLVYSPLEFHLQSSLRLTVDFGDQAAGAFGFQWTIITALFLFVDLRRSFVLYRLGSCVASRCVSKSHSMRGVKSFVRHLRGQEIRLLFAFDVLGMHNSETALLFCCIHILPRHVTCVFIEV